MKKAILLILALLLTFFAFPIRCEANTVETWAVIVGASESAKMFKSKPELNTLEACSPPSPKGRAERETKNKGEE